MTSIYDLFSAESYRWNSLEADESEDSNVKTFEVAPQVAPTVSYPTSSKKPKDWNKLERDVSVGIFLHIVLTVSYHRQTATIYKLES